ncbi:MAG: hypothetical protein WCK35_14560 [Chloroflexota bacterium]
MGCPDIGVSRFELPALPPLIGVAYVSPRTSPWQGIFFILDVGYAGCMDILSTLNPGTLIVICAPHAAREPISSLAAQLALRGPLTILDGGNRFQPYRVAQLLRQQTVDVERAARRLFVRRAFTCYQVLALLEDAPPLRQPHLVLDLLATFQDEHVQAQEARRLLGQCLFHLERLCQAAPLVVSISPRLLPGREFLLDEVCARAGQLFLQSEPLAQICQPTLFEL